MLKFTTIALSAIFSFTTLLSQELYIPRDVKQAYKKQTRSPDGKPGVNYWQNFGRYNISITAAVPDRNIKGSETITYFNNSKDTLRSLNIKLFLNIHKAGVPRDYGVGKDYITSGIHIDGFVVNGQKQQWMDDPSTFTNRQIQLPKPLLPKDSVQISFDWHFEISKESGREGMLDSSTYFLAYFYPRVAVYDDYNGWDKMNFSDGKEFYSDFNDYNLTVNVPKNFVVWATGDLQNPEAVLQTGFHSKYKESLVSDQLIHLATKEDMDSNKVTTQNEMNSWKFSAGNIPDVALALSNHYVWDASSIVVDKKTNRRASVQSGYPNNSADFQKMVEFGKHSLEWFSGNWPGIAYPYSKMSIIQGFADMEYPMMVNDNSIKDLNFSRFVAEHEIAHSYFPFYMGINETRFGFMDEGWATTLELLISNEDLGVKKAEENYKRFRVNRWINDPNQEQDIPIITPGNSLGGPGSSSNQYVKASLGYLAIKDLLGDELFKKCLQEYMVRWNGKHPIPWDFFFTFNDAAGKNLNWFWNDWFFTNGYIDLAIDKLTPVKNGYTLVVNNIGGYPAPVNIILVYEDGSTESLHQTAAIWQANQKMCSIQIASKKNIKTLQLNGGIFMDADMSNNSWKSN